jgi:hypothetical protein
METLSMKTGLWRAVKALGRLALAASLFALLAPSPAASAPQPQVCRAAHAISV